MTLRLLVPIPAPCELTVSGMLEIRATSQFDILRCHLQPNPDKVDQGMAWSRALPLPSMLGVDGSLLALASRSGRVALWR